jgi:hypothetical protein
MDGVGSAERIRVMEDGIAQQVAEIERLERSGQDTSNAAHQLTLLRHTLKEMRRQLGQRPVSELNTRQSDIAAALKFLSQKSRPR